MTKRDLASVNNQAPVQSGIATIEEALRASESRFRALVTATSDTVYRMSPDWKMMLHLHGHDFLADTEQPSATWLQEYIHPDDQAQVMAAIDEAIRAGNIFELEHRVRRVDGTWGWTFTRAIPIQNAKGEIVEWFGAASDITQRKRAEEDLRSKQAQLMDSQRLPKVGSWQVDVATGTCQDVTDVKRAQEESFARQKLESLGMLVGGIAHDFNNLLSAILAQAELAMAESHTESRADERLEEIRNVAIRGSEIVRQLMIYAGIEDDVPDLVDVSRAIDGILGLLKATVSKSATLVVDLHNNLPMVKVRAAQVRQIVMNLVGNASDAIKNPEGIVRVTTRLVTVGNETAGATSEDLVQGEYVQIEVADTGSAMSPETQAKPFDPFFTTQSAGRGLGLAVVSGIVRSLNGAIRVVSELNKGTTFQVLLPCAGASLPSPLDMIDGMDAMTGTSQKATVLVVEDEHALRVAVAKMLDKAGFGVLQVDNGSDAIELLRSDWRAIDVILLDLTIPGAPSADVLAEAVRTTPQTKVILTSAFHEGIASSILDAPQVCAFVRKPFQFGNLVHTLRSVLSSNVSPRDHKTCQEIFPY